MLFRFRVQYLRTNDKPSMFLIRIHAHLLVNLKAKEINQVHM